MTTTDETRHRGLIVRTSDAPAFVGLPASTFYDLARQPGFPTKLRLGPRTTGYLRDELEAWVRRHAEREAA